MQQAGTQDKPLFGATRWELPPLILHPFTDAISSDKLLEGSRAAIVLSGLLPSDKLRRDQLDRKILEGRFFEIRMLYFIGKDVFRWVDQCVEFAQTVDELSNKGIREQSFSLLLISDPPEAVKEKLHGWGVSDYPALFSRAIALNAIFARPPDFDELKPSFIRNYHLYADQVLACFHQTTSFTEIGNQNFHFELYSSGEYSRMLEKEWEKNP